MKKIMLSMRLIVLVSSLACISLRACDADIADLQFFGDDAQSQSYVVFHDLATNTPIIVGEFENTLEPVDKGLENTLKPVDNQKMTRAEKALFGVFIFGTAMALAGFHGR